MADADIAIGPEHPEADPAHIKKGVVRHGLKPMRTQTEVALPVDDDVLDWFKGQGAGYQARMSAVLRAYCDTHKRG